MGKTGLSEVLPLKAFGNKLTDSMHNTIQSLQSRLHGLKKIYGGERTFV